MPKPLHERLRDLIPDSVKKRIPESVKEKIRPPAWREPEPTPDPNVTPPEWAYGETGAVKFIPGTRAMIFSQQPGGGTVATHDAKGRPLPAAIQLAYGTEGTITGVGPDFVVFRVGPENAPVTKDRPAAIFRVPKSDIIHVQPESQRDWTRRGSIVVTAADLFPSKHRLVVTAADVLFVEVDDASQVDTLWAQTPRGRIRDPSLGYRAHQRAA